MVEDFIEGVASTRAGVKGGQLRWSVLYISLGAVMALIIGRSFYLQVVHGRQFELQAEDNRVAVLPLTAPRGMVYDRDGQQLLENVASADVVVDPTSLPNEENEAPLYDHLLTLLDISADELRDVISEAKEQQRVTLLYRALEHEKVIQLESVLDRLSGIRVVSSSVRNYQYPFALAHTLGYTGTSDSAGGDVGKTGLERQYDSTLLGQGGAAFREVDAAGRPQKDLGMTEPKPGDDVRLTIDVGLQEYIYSLMEERGEQQAELGIEQPVSGAVVALDPRDGAVVALVSFPSFDPNVFAQPARWPETASLLEDQAQPLFNRAISGTYAPGSTVKPLLAAAGLEEGIITPETTWLSSGGIRIGQWWFPDWKAGGHGSVNLSKALAESVNTFFYLVAGGDETRRGLGVEVIEEYLQAFKWGSETGIDVPGEAAGFLPSSEWKLEKYDERWYIGDTYHLGIGQGDLLVTPLQVAVATAALANGGEVWEPFVNQAAGSHGKKLPVSGRHIKSVRKGMRAVVVEGSARNLSNLSLPLAGKTGTAQVGGSEDTHAWFTSFGPYEKPELVVTVLLEKGGAGDTDAVPMARKIWEWWAENEAL